MMSDSKYIRTFLTHEQDALITTHYIEEVLPQQKSFQKFHCNRFLALVDAPQRPLTQIFATSKKCNERQIEDALIRPILQSLGNQLIAQVPIEGDFIDFCAYEAADEAAFDRSFANTTAIIESKRYGRIENKYYVKTEDNEDEVYQTLNYLRTANLLLEHRGIAHHVQHAVLTDGYRWRIYARNFTHSVTAYEAHFIEFDLEAIVACPDPAERAALLKIFALFFCKESLAGQLARYQKESTELETAVTVALKEQTFMALEYIATGIWRGITDENPLLMAVLDRSYGIDWETHHEEAETRAAVLRLVYQESVVYLLRLLFVLFAEDRGLFAGTGLTRVIKGDGSLLEHIIERGRAIGDSGADAALQKDDDVKLARLFEDIDKRYNGGLFSKKRHPLLYRLDIDDELFINAIDNLCRVEIKKRPMTVDFSTVSIREMGSIYESLLNYKLAPSDADVDALPSIVNKKRLRKNVRKGDLYLINHDGERKATGSYYTPDLIVEHLIHTALDPKLDAVKQAHAGDFAVICKAVYDIKIVDPAMGSGHMLYAAYDRILSFLHQCYEEIMGSGPDVAPWEGEVSYRVRTQVARKCIYGVDLNPMAVELAKLVMWMRVFRPDKPFEFFDYNLACGNSLIGVYDEREAEGDALVRGLFRSQAQIEADIQADLLDRVSTMLEMPRETVAQVHDVMDYWTGSVRPLQKQVAFFYNVKLARWLLPERSKLVNEGYETLIQGIDADSHYVEKVVSGDPSIPSSVRALADIDATIRTTYQPLHWRIAFPHIAVAGGFDIVLTNPPWDKVKPYRGEFFSDYIDGYDRMETKEAKAASDALMAAHPAIAAAWQAYDASFQIQNHFYADAYRYQVVKDSQGKQLKGDNNLYKIFIEKVFTILRDGGTCGIVVPDNLNIDNGCTGLRRLLMDEATIRELVMFENRKKLFDIDSRYKYDVLTFDKKRPRKNFAFDAGFYWYDPIWLDGTPSEAYIAQDEKNRKCHHVRYRYASTFIRNLSPDTLTILEFRNKSSLDIFSKMIAFPAIGDEREALYIRTYNEFHMTNDADLFQLGGNGWPLYQGGMVHHFNPHFKAPERFIVREEGETRLAKKWRCEAKALPDRTYRIAWRDIAQPTDTRSLICCVVPRGAFVGNTLNLVELKSGDAVVKDSVLIAGLCALLSSHVCDFYVRQRMAKHVNAFILKELPVPRDEASLRLLGDLALPLFAGDDFEVFRDGRDPIEDADARQKQIAKIDAKLARMYKITYEEYQAILATFPLEEETFKKRCLLAFNDWLFEE